MTWIRAQSVVAVALVGSALLAGCNGNEAAEEDPERLLEQTFGESGAIESGVVEAGVELSLDSGDGEEAQRVDLSGPFVSGGEGRPPQFELSVDQALDGEGGGDLRLIATPDAGYVSYEGASYEVDPAVFRRFTESRPLSGLQPARWFGDPSNEGVEEVEGTDMIRVSGTANAEALAADLEQAARRIGLRSVDLEALPQSFEEATIEMLTTADERILRRLELRLAWQGELEGGDPFDAALGVSLALSEVNEDQRVEAPEDARPLGDLAEPLPSELSGLAEFLSGTPTS